MATPSQRTFRPSYRNPNGDIQFENKTASAARSRDQLITCMLILSLSLAALSSSFTIHLAIENYKRMLENKELLMKIDLLNKEVFNPEKLTAANAINDTSTASWHSVKETPKQTTDSLSDAEVTNGTKAKFKCCDNAQTKTTLYPHRYYVAKFREIGDSLREFQSGQRFLRQQIHQRLGALDRQYMGIVRNMEYHVAFHAILGQDFSPGPTGEIIRFDQITMNDGGGFESGYFRSPVTGLYLVTAHILLLKRDARDSLPRINVVLRKNHRPYASLIRQNFGGINPNGTVYHTGGVYDALVPYVDIIKLSAGDVIDLFVDGASRWSVAGPRNLYRSEFAGVLLRKKLT
nr:uncharacterized protein LOC100185930 [Ciona intestinalis]|eukprot:XP_002123266.1 uncharacterized protein LOC100185930 [Ciona intestinalis]